MKIKYPKSLLFYSRNTATAKKLEVDFSLVTLPGCIWRNRRYTLTKEEVYYLFHVFIIMFTSLGGLYSLFI